MRRFVRPALGLLILAIGVASLNVFGNELNTLFVRYPGIDKVLHTVGYVGLFLVVFWLTGSLASDRGTRATWAAALTLLLSLGDEALQALSPARSLEAFDVVANVAAVSLGCVIVRGRRDLPAVAVSVVALGASAYVTWDTYVRLIDFSRGVRYSQQQDFVRAREHFQLALSRGLRTPALYNELGWVEIESGVGNPEKAVEYAKTALSMQPGNFDTLDTYGWALHHAGRTREAVEVLQRVYAARPNMFCIHYHLGSAYLAAGEREKAEFHFAQQVERKGTREAVFARQALDRLGHHQ
jgi:tetratricopeptide (TPR) repeat protein